MLIPAFAFTHKYLAHMQAWAFASRTMRAWQQAEQLPSGAFRKLSQRRKRRSVLGPEHFEELFQGYVPQLSVYPVLSAVTTRSAQGHAPYRDMLFPLLPRLIWITFHSLLLWKYQKLSFKSKPNDYTYTLMRRE